MAIATYTDLVGAVKDWLGRANDSEYLTEARVGDMIAFAEADIYRRLRVREMEAAVDLTVDDQTVDLPTGYVETRRIYLTGSPLLMLEYRAPPQFWGEVKAATTGQPSTYTIEGDSIVFGPAPDATYTGKHLYYKKLPALSSATNTLFTDNPDLFLYGALMHAAPFTGAEDAARMQMFAGLFETAVARAQQQSDRSRYSGAPLVMRVG